MKGINVFKILFFIVIPVLFVSFAFWYFQGSRTCNIYILDKTVLDKGREEHKSFNWVLNYYKYTKNNHKLYNYKKDYYGFFPEFSDNGNTYKIRSLRLYEILSIADDIDVAYYADTYGVTYQDWFHKVPDKFHSPLIYGGLNQNDYLLLSELKRKNKLIITEFNMLGSPTSGLIREKTQTLFDFYWSGWTGCYFRSLSQSNPGLPDWIVQQYEIKYQKNWSFKGPGIILVNENGDVVVLQYGVHLTEAYPKILTNNFYQKKYGIPASQSCNFWFDIIKPGTTNKVVSIYQLPVTSQGLTELKQFGLSPEFPAIIEHLDQYKFYYFAGDFADRSISMASSYLKGYPEVARFLTIKHSASRKNFFWRFYLPLIHHILSQNLALLN